MTKAERLLYIVNLFRVRKKIRLTELSRECEVSERTIYRDLTSLSSINVPIYYDDGYRLAREVSLPPLNFTDDELELLGFCLRNSTLCKSDYLRNKIKMIEMKILSALPEKGKNRLANHFAGNISDGRPFEKREDEIIKSFLRALFEGRSVEIRLKIRGKTIPNALPRAVNIRGDKWELTFLDSGTSRPFAVALKSIDRISVSERGKGGKSDQAGSD